MEKVKKNEEEGVKMYTQYEYCRDHKITKEIVYGLLAEASYWFSIYCKYVYTVCTEQCFTVEVVDLH